MIIRIIGAALIVTGCVGFGFKTVFLHKREVHALKQIISALNYMESELQYRLTALPKLCQIICKMSDGIIFNFFQELTTEFENQISPDVKLCVDSVLSRLPEIPPITRKMLQSLGMSLGRFDIDGQLQDLEIVKNECIKQLELCTCNEESRLRNYRTFAACIGIAIVIILF